MIQTTRWSPDTCGCVVEYQWDDAVSADQRTHAVSNVVTKCAAHATTPDHAAHFTKVNDENKRKNLAMKDIIDNFTILTQTNSDGSVILKDNVVTWTFDANRRLLISVTGLTANQRNQLQTLVNNRFGADKVIIS